MVRQLNVNVTEELDDIFRKVVAETKGLRKGSISNALTEAMELWIKENKKK